MLWSYSTGLDLTDRGLQFGDGLFETFLCWRGEIWLQEEHVARLQQGCERLQLDLPPSQLTEVLQRATDAARNQPAQGVVGKLIVTACSPDRGYARPPGCQTNVHAALFPLNHDPSAIPEPVDVTVSHLQLASQPALAGIKHLNRLEQVLAQQMLNREKFFDALMCDQQNQLIEGTYCNVLLGRQGQLFTPRLNNCGVAGVLRQRLLREFDVTEQDIPLHTISDYDELILGNSVTGLRSVARVLDPSGESKFQFAGSECYELMHTWLQAALAELGPGSTQ